jgi:signal peptidase I
MTAAHTTEPTRPAHWIARLVLHTASVAGWLVVIVGGLLLIVPAVAGLERYVITGNSMAPEFHRGSVVFSEAVPVDELVVGDIITYQPPPETRVTQLVTHRIVSIDAGEDGRPLFTTRGDNNDTADPWEFQLQSDTQNVVRYDLPLIGHILAFLSDPSNRLVIIGIPAALIALRALFDVVRAFRGSDDDDEDDHEDDDDHAAADSTPVAGDDPELDLSAFDLHPELGGLAAAAADSEREEILV